MLINCCNNAKMSVIMQNKIRKLKVCTRHKNGQQSKYLMIFEDAKKHLITIASCWREQKDLKPVICTPFIAASMFIQMQIAPHLDTESGWRGEARKRARASSFFSLSAAIYDDD